MKKLATLFLSISAFVALPTVSHAICIATGQLSRVSVNPGAGSSSFYVTTSAPAQPSFLYTTTDIKIVSAVVAAETSHMTVQVTGNAAACPAPVGGVRNGGAVVTFTMAP